MPGSDGSQRFTSNTPSTQSHNPSLDHSETWLGAGSKWFDKAGDVCLSCLYVESPLTCQVHVKKSLETMAWKKEGKSNKGYPGLWVEQSHNMSLQFKVLLYCMAAQCLGSISSRLKDICILNANICTWINFMQPWTSKEESACACVCPHTFFFLPLCLSLPLFLYLMP